MNKDQPAESSVDPRADSLYPLPSKHRRRRSRHSNSSTSTRGDRRVRNFFAVLATAVTVGAVAFLFGIYPLRSQLLVSRSEATHLQHLLNLAGDEIETLQAQRDVLVGESIPGLQPLTLDETIPIENSYLRYIVFTLTAREGRPEYEFTVVLQNNRRGEVVPDVSVRLFNKVGIQIGAGQIHLEALAFSTGSPTLAPGEVQSYSGNIEMTDPNEPAYYLLQVG